MMLALRLLSFESHLLGRERNAARSFLSPVCRKRWSTSCTNRSSLICKRAINLNQIIKVRLLHTAGAGESDIDEKIGEFETLTNPTVGLAAHTGIVDIRIAAKAETEAEADRMITDVENQLRERLGLWSLGLTMIRWKVRR